LKTLIVFDLDGTLAESKSSIDAEMARLLSSLLEIVRVAIISGGAWQQFERQVLANLCRGDSLGRLSLLPTCGTKFYAYESGWKLLYSEDFSESEKAQIIDALRRTTALPEYKASTIWGETIEDRGSQITFSALGQMAPLDEKKRWDPDFSKRMKIKAALDRLIPQFSVRLGGATSVDVTQKGIDKAYASLRGSHRLTVTARKIPMRIVSPVQGLFAVAVVSVAILTLCYGDFVPMGQAFPVWIAWRQTWVYASALLILVAGVGLCFPRTALSSALTIYAYQAIWALICALPVISKPFSVGAWYGFCEALAPLVGAWILYATLRWQAAGSQMPIATERAVRAAQGVFGLTCVFYGWSHFAFADYTAGMVPAWLPGRLGLAYLTGLGHIAAGIGIVLWVLPRLAATLEAIMMSFFGLLVWVPSFFMQPTPDWATPPQNQWSELVVSLVLAATAWVVASSLRQRPWGLALRRSQATTLL
jgi:phosphomannomutase